MNKIYDWMRYSSNDNIKVIIFNMSSKRNNKNNTYDDSSHNFEKGKNLEGISFDADNETTSSSPLCRGRSVWTYCCPGIATATAATSEREGRPVESLRRDQVVMIVMSCFDCLLSCRRFSLGFVQASA